MRGLSAPIWPGAVDDPRMCPSHGHPMDVRIFRPTADAHRIDKALMCPLCAIHAALGGKFFEDRMVRELRRSQRGRNNPMGI